MVRRRVLIPILLAVIFICQSLPVAAADNIGSLVNPCFATSWTYRSGGVPSPPGGWFLAGWAASAGGPQYYNSAELSNGRQSDHRCKWEFNGGGVSGNNVIAKEVNWGAYTSVTVTVWCAGRTWGGTNGDMKLGIDTNGGGTQWSDCGTNTTTRTSNNETWAQLTKTVSKPAGATTFTVMLNGVPSGTTWNCQFDKLEITGSGGSAGTISGYVKDACGTGIGGATVQTTTGGYSTTTASNGSYTLSNVVVGTYSVSASKTWFQTQTQNNISVTSGQTTTCNFTLATVAGENIGSLTNLCFATSWTYRSGGVPSPPGGWFLAGWAASGGGPAYYTGMELQNGRKSDHRCKWEFNGGGVSGNNVIAKEVNWGAYSSVTVKAWCAGRTWGGTTGSMKLGVDPSGGASAWADCGSNNVSRTSNDQTWAQLTKTVTKPAGATTFTILLNAVPNGTTWNCQFDLAEVTASGGSVGTISGYVKDVSNNALSGATVQTSTGGYSTTSLANGSYTLSNVAAGTYDVTASKSGYVSQTNEGVAVTSGQTTTSNFNLAIAGRSKVGLHIVPGGRDGYGAFLAQTSGAGKPVALIKCVEDMSPAYEAKTYSTQTLTVGRFCYYNGVDYNNLGGWIPTHTPQQAADQIYPAMKVVWDQHPYIDVWELCNEWDSDYAWQADYYIAMMNKAEPDGYRVAIFSSSVGTPDFSVYADVARACARAKASGNHLLALHEYGLFGSPALLMTADPYLVLRYRMLYSYLVQNNSECPIILTEVGQNGGYEFVGDSLFIQDFGWYDDRMREDSYVLGCAAWTLGPWANANCYTALPELADYICAQ